MNKAVIEELLPKAYDIIRNNSVICENGKVDKAYRSQISSFGAAVSGGSLLSAIAFFSVKGQSPVERPELMECIRKLIPEAESSDSLFGYVATQEASAVCKEQVLNAAISLKLAFNLFDQSEEQKPAGEG